MPTGIYERPWPTVMKVERIFQKDRQGYERERAPMKANRSKRNRPPRAVLNEATRLWTQRARVRVIMFHGGKCGHCGMNDMRCLQIDHVFGGGLRELRGPGGNSRKILKNALLYPERYQVLCANCNWIKRFEQGENSHNKAYCRTTRPVAAQPESRVR